MPIFVGIIKSLSKLPLSMRKAKKWIEAIMNWIPVEALFNTV
jgi:hypothetical protein